MNLLIDVGNTRIKWALADAGRLVERGSIEHRDKSDEALVALAEVAARPAAAAFLASVMADPFNDRLIESLRDTGKTGQRVRVAPDLHGVRIAYEDPASLGVDRWLAMIAAWGSISGAACVVSAGTAVTFDAIDVTGRHLGGFIWPGPRMVADVLARQTDRIGATPVAGRAPSGLRVLGTSTAEAVGHGSRFAIAAAIDRAVKIVATGTGSEPALLVTGGDAGALTAWLESRATVEPDLVLEGLRIVATAVD
jgi:type III pantothenate kinase